jgi:hypothetical protein
MKNFRIFASLCLLLCLGGFAMAQTPNASSSTPAAPAGGQNCQFQSSGVNFSCYIPSGVYDVFGAATTAVATERATAANAGNLSSGTIPLSRLPGSGVTTISGTSCTIGGSCSPAGGGGGSTSDAKRIVYQQNCWTSLSDFTVVGTSPTPALCGIPLSVAGGTGTSTAQNLMLTASTNDGENEVVNVSYTLTNILGPGFDIAKQGINTMTHPFGLSVRIDPSTNTGYLEFLPTLQATNGTRNVLTSKALSVVMAAGDNIQILIYRSGTYIDAAINDITQQTTDIITYKYPQGTFATATNTVANSGQWGFFDEGGAVNVTNFSVAALDVASPAVCFVGDSKTVGSQFAADFRQRWAANLGIFGTTAIFAGGGDGTAEVLADLPQIVAAGCQKVLLNIGRNPVCNGVTTATWEAQYTSIINGLVAAGIPVVHLLAIPETSCAQTGLNSFITGTFTSGAYPTAYQTIDPSVGFSTSTMLGSDGVHPNATGNGIIRSDISGAGIIATAAHPVFYLPPAFQAVNQDVQTPALPAATVYLNTTFNEATSGTLAGTTPAACTNGCTGTWTLPGGTGFTFANPGITTSTAGTNHEVINTGVSNEVARTTLTACSATGSAYCQIVVRWSDETHFIAVNITPSTGQFAVDDCVSTCTVKGTSSAGTYLGQYIITLSGTSVSVTGPQGTASYAGSTVPTTGYFVGFYDSSSTAMSISQLSVKSN